MSASRIAFQGVPGAYSEAAALKIDPSCITVPCHSFDEVFDAVENGIVDLGVLPMENSTQGTVHANYRLFVQRVAEIVAEVEVLVEHQLLARQGVMLQDVRRVYSHPQALGQCRHYLSGLGVEQVEYFDTAASAEMVAKQNLRDAAAIASARAGNVYGLVALASAVQDHKNNTTRFAVIGTRRFNDMVYDKSTFMFRLPNKPGALTKIFSSLASLGLNVTKIETQPIPEELWGYWFFVDVTPARTPAFRLREFLFGPNAWRFRPRVTWDNLDDLRGQVSEIYHLGTYTSWNKRSQKQAG